MKKKIVSVVGSNHFIRHHHKFHLIYHVNVNIFTIVIQFLLTLVEFACGYRDTYK